MVEDDRQQRLGELQRLRARVQMLESELQRDDSSGDWQAKGFYLFYHATTGFMLGMIGAITSLLFNIVGSLAVNQHPLKLVQIYLTFPLGERAMTGDFNSGIALAIGCCLYVGTGMVLGIPFQLVTARVIPNARLGPRLMLATILGLAVWIFNFYGVLSWLQPLLFDGSWILENIPLWVAAATHLVFAWTMAIVYPLGAYKPYRRQTGPV